MLRDAVGVAILQSAQAGEGGNPALATVLGAVIGVLGAIWYIRRDQRRKRRLGDDRDEG
ncbi:MAG: hypothetical protein M3N51_06215 [Actinomycetota bacterium]|nr:hypothetical protein [Actinomycetota bacterium]